MTRTQFIDRVIAILNEAGITEIEQVALLGAEAAQLDKHIENGFAGAWSRLAQIVPLNWLNKKTGSKNVIETDVSKGTGSVRLPDDFFALVRFRMSLWRKPVFSATPENELVSVIQSNEYTQGSVIRPVCVISTDTEIITDPDSPTGDSMTNIFNVLRYYSLPRGLSASQHSVSEFIYIPIVDRIDSPVIYRGENSPLELMPQFIEPLAYDVAANTAMIIGKPDIAAALELRATGMIPGIRKAKALYGQTGN
ncbi:MAG: hypothetical protein LBJ17_05400 [Dysgonamonadaceae bacterium]|jgi:hypothetical protein|nr:hypothetical protein [Dysgonamonadaceae bacterium]